MINTGHTYADIYLPIDAQQKALFDAIDGRTPICALAPDEESRLVAATLFERLWQYDQVVFDASKSGFQA